MLKKSAMILLLPLFLMVNRAEANYELGGCEPCFQDCNTCCDTWYGIVGAGYAFSTRANIEVGPTWDFANEGYNDDLGGAPFFFIGFGRTFCCWLDFDVTYSQYDTFRYQRYQTGVSATPGFSGPTRTRYFDLDHQNLMFDLTIDPTWDCLRWNFCSLNIRPIIGAGVGVGVNRISNFHTVGFFTDGDEIGVGSTTSIGDIHTRTSFAWQVLAALRFGFCGCAPLTMDIGYRYYSGGHFRGPSDIVRNTADGLGAVFSTDGWKGRLRANEVYLALNYGF